MLVNFFNYFHHKLILSLDYSCIFFQGQKGEPGDIPYVSLWDYASVHHICNIFCHMWEYVISFNHVIYVISVKTGYISCYTDLYYFISFNLYILFIFV